MDAERRRPTPKSFFLFSAPAVGAAPPPSWPILRAAAAVADLMDKLSAQTRLERFESESAGAGRVDRK